MIYTIGHRENYWQAILESEKGVILKTGRTDDYVGGYAFQTIADASKMIDSMPNGEYFAVFGLDADWDDDTELSRDGWWHNLINSVPIIVLDEESFDGEAENK